HTALGGRTPNEAASAVAGRRSPAAPSAPPPHAPNPLPREPTPNTHLRLDLKQGGVRRHRGSVRRRQPVHCDGCVETTAARWQCGCMRSENAEGSGNHTGLRSDSLPSIVRALEALPELQSLISPKLIRLAVVVDASVINAELRWRLARRRRPENRSALFEAVDAGVVTIVAPLFLAAEIEEHLVEIAAQTGSSVEAAMVEWKAIRPKLRFYAPPYGTPVSNVVDPDDIAYVDSSKALGLPVYTRDAHFQTMGAPAVLDRIDLELRDHARGITMTLTFTVGSAAALAGIFAILRQALVGVRGLLGAFSSLPDAVQALLIGGVLVALACP